MALDLDAIRKKLNNISGNSKKNTKESSKPYFDKAEDGDRGGTYLHEYRNGCDPVMEQAVIITAELEGCLDDLRYIEVQNAMLMDSLVTIGVEL